MRHELPIAHLKAVALGEHPGRGVVHEHRPSEAIQKDERLRLGGQLFEQQGASPGFPLEYVAEDAGAPNLRHQPGEGGDGLG